MKKLLILSSVLFFALCSGGLAGATLITFDSLTPGSSMPSYSEAGVTFSTTTGDPLYVYPGLGKTGIVGNTSLPWAPIIADFDYNTSSVSVLLGDLSSDTEDIYLNAYDDSNNLIAQTIDTLSGPGWITVSVANSSIDHVIWSSVNTNPSLNNSLLADSFEFASIPDPSMVFLLGSACLLGAGLRQRLKK